MNTEPNVGEKNSTNRSKKRHCLRCGYKWSVKCTEPKRCPSCSSYLWNVPPDDYKCLRCGHTWRRRGTEVPNLCPKCKSKKWNIPKTPYKTEMNAPLEGDIDILELYKSGMGCVKIAMKTNNSIAVILEALHRCLPPETYIRM